jgi:cytochrome oxidase Cu insertion factor (SCO1/SenC/PrrC family)
MTIRTPRLIVWTTFAGIVSTTRPGQNEQSGADLISHSTFLYLMNPGGKLAALFSQDITADKLAATLRARVAR